MHLGFSKNTIEQIQEYTRVCGVIKKKRDQGSLAALVVSSTPKWFCFRGLGRFLVYYDSDKKPVEFLLDQGAV